MRCKKNKAARFVVKRAAPRGAQQAGAPARRRKRRAIRLGLLGDGAWLEEIRQIGGVCGIAEIRTDVEDVLPGTQIG
jgi:hypothetical protein